MSLRSSFAVITQTTNNGRHLAVQHIHTRPIIHTIKIKFIIYIKCTMWSYVYYALYKNTRVFTRYITVYKTLYPSCRACLHAFRLIHCPYAATQLWGHTQLPAERGFMSPAGWERFHESSWLREKPWVQLAERGCHVPSWLRSHQPRWLRVVMRSLVGWGSLM